jgi:hypothetical protein
LITGTSGNVKHATARLDIGQFKHHLSCSSIDLLTPHLSSAPPISALRESPFFSWESRHIQSSYFFRDSIETMDFIADASSVLLRYPRYA